MHIANQAKQVSSNSKNSGIDYVPVYYSGNSFEGTTNISLAIVNDWVNDKVTKSQKQLFMDALLNIFSFKMDMDAFASAVHFGNNQNGDAGMLGFYGDDIDNAGQTYYKDQLDVLMNAFNTNWIKGWAELLNKVYDEGSSSIQGPSYGELAARNMMPMALIMSTAMGTNYISEVSYLRDYGFYDLYFTLPMPYSGVYYPLYTDDSSLIKKTKAYGKNKIIFKPLMYGLQLENPDLASLLKWYWEKSGIFIEKNSSNLRWYMIYDLILGTKNLSPKNPSEVGLPLSKRIGNGEYALRTGFTDPNDTLIAFFATKYHTNDGAHAHRDFGSFRIFKHGRLAITRSIAKGFPGGGSAATEDNMFYNTIGVYRPGEDNYKGWFNLMGYRRGFNNRSIDPDHVDWGIGGRNNVGLVLHDDLNGGEYDYIHYDYTNSWAASGSYVQKVDVAHREFLYLRSAGGKNDEFVVIFDRVNSVNSTYKKYFLLHSSFEPKLFNNATQVSMAAENYPNDGDGAGGGRWVKKTSSPARDNIIEITNTFNGSHGRLYSKTLLPSSFQINKTGGPGHYWEDAEGKLIKTKENMNDKTKDFRGTFTMQVESKTGQKFDNFLNVMQIGDSNTLVSMTPVEKISATGGNGNMAGALIKDSNKNRVVLFNSSNPSIVGSIKPNIEYTLSTTAPSSHVLFNTSPNTLYSIKRNGVELLNFQSSGGGVVKFEDPTAGESVTYLVELGGSSLEEYPSEPQRQIEVQTLSGPERVRLTWYQSKDDTLNGNVNYTIYYDTSPSFGSP
ncbi:MAG: hypothetical protein ACE5FU_11135, partial [Nitrospinota bacterium]